MLAGLAVSTAGPSHSETWAAPDPRSAKVLFVPCPSVISYPALHGHDPGGGAHGNSHPTTRIYTRTGWRGGHLASRSAGAAGADACSRISALGVSAKLRTAGERLSRGSGKRRLCRRPKCRDRVSLGGKSARPAAGARRRPGPPPRRGNRSLRQPP